MKLFGYFLFGVLFFASCLISSGEEPDFRVLGKRGAVSFQSKSGAWQEVKTGDQLFRNDKIKVSSDGYLGLVHSSGKTVEIRKEGTYNISKLTRDVSSYRNSTSQRFAKYVIDEVTSGDDILAAKKYRRNMEKTGAVERATGEDISYTGTLAAMTGSNLSEYSALNEAVDFLIKTDKNYIKIKYPRTSYFIDNTIDFVWYKNSSVSVYEFIIIDRNNSEIYSTKTSDTTLKVNLSDLRLLKGTNYYWYVQSNDIKSDQYGFNWMNDYEKNRVQDEVEPIVNEMAKGKDAASLIMLASIYEDENIMNRAVEAYDDALRIEPDVDGYRTLYARYLGRIGLDVEAFRIMK